MDSPTEKETETPKYTQEEILNFQICYWHSLKEAERFRNKLKEAGILVD